MNATASALAGHTIKGEACLVCGSPPSASELGPSTPTPANPSPLLSTSPPTAPSAAAAEQLLAELLAGRKLLASGPTTRRPTARDHAAPAPASPTPTTVASAPLDVPPRAAGVGQQQQQQRDIVRGGSPPQAPAAVHGTIRAILQSRNAPMTHHQCDQCKQQHGIPHPHAQHQHLHQHQHHPQAPHRPPTWSSASGCTSPASRSSLDLDPRQHNQHCSHHTHQQQQQCRRSTGGGSLVATDSGAQQEHASPRRRHAPLAPRRAELVEQPAHAAPAALAASGHRLRAAHHAGDTHAAAPDPLPHSPPVVPSLFPGALTADTLSMAGATATTDAPGGAGECPLGGPVPWSELPQDVVASVALALPRRASRGLLAMAATCRAWRAALLCHVPVLLHVAFGLDPAQPLRMRAGEEGYGAAAAGATDVVRGSEGCCGGGAGGSGRHGRGGRGSVPGSELGVERETTGAAERGAEGGGERGRVEEGGDGDDHGCGGDGYDEQASRLRQYAAGAFLLPNPTHQQQQQERDADTDPHAGE